MRLTHPRHVPASEVGRLDRALAKVREEVLRALSIAGRMQTPHDGWAIIREEVDELWDEVKADKGESLDAYKEAVQVAAMGVRYVVDITDIQGENR